MPHRLQPLRIDQLQQQIDEVSLIHSGGGQIGRFCRNAVNEIGQRPLVNGADRHQVLAQPAAQFLRPLQRRFHVLFGDPLGSNQQVAQSHGSHSMFRKFFRLNAQTRCRARLDPIARMRGFSRAEELVSL